MSHQWNPGYGGRVESLFQITGSSRGTLMTSGNNAKGSYITTAASTFAWESFFVMLHKTSAAADFIVDIAIGSAGNEFIIAPDLRLSSLKATNIGTAWYDLPIHVPSGAALTARCRSSTNAATCGIIIAGCSNGIMGMPGFKRAIALYTPNGARGAAVDPGATPSTRTRVQLVASSAERVAGIFWAFGPNGDVSRLATGRLTYDIETGASSAERKLYTNGVQMWGTSGDGPLPMHRPIVPCDVAAAQRFSIYAECDVGTSGDRTVDMGMWGLVP